MGHLELAIVHRLGWFWGIGGDRLTRCGRFRFKGVASATLKHSDLARAGCSHLVGLAGGGRGGGRGIWARNTNLVLPLQPIHRQGNRHYPLKTDQLVLFANGFFNTDLSIANDMFDLGRGVAFGPFL